MSRPLLFLRHPVALSHLALAEEQDPSRDGLRQILLQLSAGIMDEHLVALLGPSTAHSLISSQLEVSDTHFCKIAAMGVTTELQNLGHAELCREIAVGIEHALSGKTGDWRVSIAGSHASESREMRVEGPNGFERSYTLSGAAGQHGPVELWRAACVFLDQHKRKAQQLAHKIWASNRIADAYLTAMVLSARSRWDFLIVSGQL
jgi:hypothetical protein